MKHFKFYLLIFVLIGTNAKPQTWHVNYNGLYLTHFNQLSNHEIVLTGNSFGWFAADSTNIILIKTDSLGNLIWSKGFGGSGHEYSNHVKQCRDSGFIVTGNTTDYNSKSSDVILLKTDKHGNLEWSKAYGGDSIDQPSVVLQTPDGGFIVGGITHSLTVFPGSLLLFLMKTDSVGNVAWIKTYGDVGNNSFSNLEITSDSSLLIVARASNSAANGYFNFYLLKIDKNGNLIWERGLGTAIYDYPSTGHETMDGGYILCGTTWGPNADMYVVKTNSAGVIEWAKQLGSGSDNNQAFDIIQTSDSNYVLTGKSDFLSETVATIIKLDRNGDTLWTNTDSENQWDHGVQIRATPGGFLIQTKVCLFKTDTIGGSMCNGRSVSYYCQNAVTSNYTIIPHTFPPYWNNIRTISIDTTNGITSSPGCSNIGYSKIPKVNSIAHVVPNPVTENHFKIILPKINLHHCNLRLIDTNGRILNESTVTPDNNGLYSFINYSPCKPLDTGLYFIQLDFPDSSYNLKFVILK